MLNVIHLRTLRECVRTHSFAAAGRQLGYTTSAVSRQMTMLERAVGTPLFERHAHSVRSTKAARLLAARSAPVLDALAELDQTASRFATAPGRTLDLGLCPSVPGELVSGATARLTAGRTDLDVRLHRASRAELVRDLHAETLDAALVVESTESAVPPAAAGDDLRRRPLLREPLLVAMPSGHRLEDCAELDAAELRGEPWIAAECGSPEALALDSLGADAGFLPDVVCRTNDHAVAAELVRRGAGVALLPRSRTPVDGLACRPLAGDTPRHAVAVLTRPAAEDGPLLEQLIGILRPIPSL